jgi:hypothetical protein
MSTIIVGGRVCGRAGLNVRNAEEAAGAAKEVGSRVCERRGDGKLTNGKQVGIR